MAFNLFQNILNPQAKEAFSQAGQQIKSAFSPLAPVATQIKQEATKISPVLKNMGVVANKVASPIVQPIKKGIETGKKITKVNDFLTQKGITADHIRELARMDGTDPNEAINALRSMGIKVQGMEEVQPQEQSTQNIYKGEQNNPIMNVVGGALAEVPNVAGNAISFLGNVAQYEPTNLLGTAVKAGFSDKTFGQLMEEQKAQANKFAEVGAKGKQFVQKYGAYNPESFGAKAGEIGTDIGASIIGPNKVGIATKLGALATPTKLALEGGLAGAKFDIGSTGGKNIPESIAVGAGGNLAIGMAFKGGQKLASALTPKTAEEKIIEKLGVAKTKGIVNGKTVNVPVTKEGIITKVSTPFRESNPKVLAGRALTPSYAGKTPKQMLKSVGEVEKNVKEFYTQVRTGKLKGSIDTLEDSANTVVQNLDDIGAKIENAVSDVKGNTAISMGTRAEMKKALTNKIEKRAGAYGPLANFFKDTSKGLSLKDAFKAKKVYQAEIGKLIKSGDAGTDSYSALVKGVQELSDNIDNAVMKNIKGGQFKEWKSQYALLKKLVNDISKSAVVEGRRSPQTFVEQLGQLEAIVEGVTSPLSTAKQVFAKEIGELNTRGGAWNELIKNYDKQAIKAFSNKKITPKIKVGQ